MSTKASTVEWKNYIKQQENDKEDLTLQREVSVTCARESPRFLVHAARAIRQHFSSVAVVIANWKPMSYLCRSGLRDDSIIKSSVLHWW